MVGQGVTEISKFRLLPVIAKKVWVGDWLLTIDFLMGMSSLLMD